MAPLPSEEPPASNSEVDPPEATKPEPAKPKPVSLKPPTSDKPKETPSIFGRKKKVEVKEEEEVSASTVLNKKEEEFTDEDLQTVWKNFHGQRSSSADTDKLIMSRDVNRGENYDVIISLSSQLEGSFLDKFETELIQYLRTELKNDHISLKRDVAQLAEVNKLYTSKDIYDHMAKQNPALEDLKDRLGLDFDY